MMVKGFSEEDGVWRGRGRDQLAPRDARPPIASSQEFIDTFLLCLLTGLFAALHLFSICFQHDGFLLLLHRLAFSIFYRLFPFVGNNNDGPGLFTASQK